MNISITNGTLSTHLSLLKALDKIAVDPSMHLLPEEEELLMQSGGFAVMCYNDDDQLIGGGYAVPTVSIEDFVKEVDSDFVAAADKIYIYSVAVVPNERRKGIGSRIRHELRSKAIERGFKTGCSHVRTANGWADAGKDFYQPDSTKLIKGFWPDLAQGDVVYMQFEL